MNVRLATDGESNEVALEAVLETAGDAIVVTDGDGRILFWNAAATRDWQWVPAEVTGQPLGALLFPDKAHFAEISAAVQRTGQWRGHIGTLAKQRQLLVHCATFSACEPLAGESGGFLMSCRLASTVVGNPEATLRLERLEAFARKMARAGHRLNNVISPFTMGLDMLRQRLTTSSDTALLGALNEAVEKAMRTAEDIVVEASRAMSGASPQGDAHESRSREMELFR